MFEIPPHSLFAMIAVFGLLVIASAMSWGLSRCYRDKDYTELRQRIYSWWWIVIVLFAMLAASKNIAIIFFSLLSFLALKEFFSIVGVRQADRRVIFCAYLAIPIQYYWVSIGWYGMFIIFIPVYLFLFLPLCMTLIGDTKGFIQSAGQIHWAVMLAVFSISHIAYLLMLTVQNPQAGSLGLVLFLLLLTEFNDVCQYIWGKLFGKHKIIPKVSPNKTWQGFVGSVISMTVCAGFLAPYLTPLTFTQGLLAGLMISISGFVGDVVMSSVKRDLQIKNTGTFIPGHGGILDRIDSLFYTGPLFFHFIYYH